MPWILLLKYLPYIVGVLAVVGGITYGVAKIYHNGVAAEHARCIESTAKLTADAEQKLADAVAENNLIRDKQTKNLMEALNEQAERNRTMAADIYNLRGKRMFVSTKTCTPASGSAMPTKDASTGKSDKDSGGSIVSELSEAFGAKIRDDYTGAAQTISNCTLLLKLALPHLEVVGDTR